MISLYRSRSDAMYDKAADTCDYTYMNKRKHTVRTTVYKDVYKVRNGTLMKLTTNLILPCFWHIGTDLVYPNKKVFFWCFRDRIQSFYRTVLSF